MGSDYLFNVVLKIILDASKFECLIHIILHLNYQSMFIINFKILLSIYQSTHL